MNLTKQLRNEAFVANVLGVVFIVVAILGFIPNPIVGAKGVFVTNAAHNIFHGLVGIALLAAAKTGYGKKALLVFGIVYVLVAILGYTMMRHMLFGLIMVNMADHYLHLLLGVAIIGAGVYVKEKKK